MDKTDYIENIDNAERRFFAAPVEIREEDDGATIYGIASSVNSRYDMGWYEEEVLSGAFDEALNDDVRALFNHDPNQILGRTKSKTLRIFIDDAGNLAYELKLPNRSYAKDLADAIRSGDVDQSSFAFRIKEQNWLERDGEPEVRQIVKVERLYDVSPVTYPANPNTSVAKRSWQAQKPEDTTEAEEPKRTKTNALKRKKLSLRRQA